LVGGGIYNVLVASDGNRETWGNEIVWNAGAAASRCKTAMNRIKAHRINHEHLQNQ